MAKKATSLAKNANIVPSPVDKKIMKKAAKLLPNKKNATRTPPRLHDKQQQKGAKGPPKQKKNAPIQPKSPAKRKKASKHTSTQQNNRVPLAKNIKIQLQDKKTTTMQHWTHTSVVPMICV